MGVAFLSNCPLVLSLLKYRDVGAFLNQKKEDHKTGEALLNSSIEN